MLSLLAGTPYCRFVTRALQLLLELKWILYAVLCCRTYAHYCSATYNLQHNYPSMLASQMQSGDEECAICKEPMKVPAVMSLLHTKTCLTARGTCQGRVADCSQNFAHVTDCLPQSSNNVVLLL